MYQLSDSHIASWKQESSAYVPAAVDVDCPDCGRMLTFALSKWSSAPGNTKISINRCAACNSRCTFFLLSHRGKEKSLGSARLFVHKKPPGREPLASILENDRLAEPVQRAYLSTVNVFNNGEWGATAVLSRRLLEGVTKSPLPEEHHGLSLAQQVAKLPEQKNLAAPITTIADAIRRGGNLGAHFDLEAEPTKEVALLMLELVEELLEYFFVLPDRIEELHERIERLGNEA